jgi:hypothetical protein
MKWATFSKQISLMTKVLLIMIIYPICNCCSGANYTVNKTFKKRNKGKCRIQKVLALFVADMQARRIAKNPERYDETTLFYTIEAIKQIRERYLEKLQAVLG